jgi:hypothetical protein
VRGSRRSTAAGGGSPGSSDDGDADPPSPLGRYLAQLSLRILETVFVGSGRPWNACVSGWIDRLTIYIERVDERDPLARYWPVLPTWGVLLLALLAAVIGGAL